MASETAPTRAQSYDFNSLICRRVVWESRCETVMATAYVCRHSKTPFTRYNLLSIINRLSNHFDNRLDNRLHRVCKHSVCNRFDNRLFNCTAGCIV